MINIILIAGDFNGRTATEADYIEIDHADHIPVPDTYNADYEELQTRTSKDRVLNTYGRELLSFCKSTQFRIINGRLGTDSTRGDYTCFNNCGASVVDYMLTKCEVMSYIKDFEVMPCTVYSDHCQLSLSLNFAKNTLSVPPVDAVKGSLKTLKWEEAKIPVYLEKLSCPETEKMFKDVFNTANGDISNIDQLVDQFSDVLHKVTDPIFVKQKGRCRKQCDYSKKANWMSDECIELREAYFQLLNLYRANPTGANQERMKHARNAYTKAAKKKPTRVRPYLY